MDKYDDYTPHIFYADEENDGENEAGRIDLTQEPKREKPKKTAQGRQSKPRTTKKQQENTTPAFFDKLRAFFASRTTAVCTGIILAGLAAYFLISFVSYIGSCISDQSVIYNHPLGSLPPVGNQGGEGGARLSEFLINGGFGLSAFVIILWLVVMALKLLVGKPKVRTLDFTLKCLIGFVTLSLIVGLLTIGTNTIINWGGYHGRYVNEWIIGFFGWWGAVILCLVMIALFVVICMRDIIKWALVKKRAYDEKRRIRQEELARQREKELALAEQRRKEMELEDSNQKKEDEDYIGHEGVIFNQRITYPETEEEVSGFEGYALAEIPEEEDDNARFMPKSAPDADNPGEETPRSVEGAGEGNPASPAEGEEETPMVVNVNQMVKVEGGNSRPANKESMYRFPSVDLLVPSQGKINVNADEQLANKEKIKQTLEEYGVPILSIEAHVGPTVTLYEIKPDRGNRISRIKGLVDEIALSLAAKGVRIIAPIPGKGTIGIEVANIKPQTVAMRSLLESRAYLETKANLPLALGATISNDVFIADLASMPHLLVAGATGQGKSVGLNVIIMSLLYKKRPDELKFVMFDPKMVEFYLYAEIQKQYLAKLPDEEEAIITDMSKVVPTLNSLCIEMENRYKKLKDAGVRKLEEYNKMIKAGEFADDPNHKFLPYIVVVIDEFADLIMTAGKEAEMPIARLAQKARAVGIHVIIATQRPSTTVITGNIKSNFPGRMAFKVSSSIDSKVILDTTGAQQLIGKGDMLILNSSELVRVQCAFIDTPEVKAICEHIGRQPYPADSPYILPEPVVAEGSTFDGNSFSGEKDPLYDEIRSYIITSGVASTSNIQRKYQLGYNRAGRIMDQLEAEGVVGPSQGGKARAVLISI